jgi:hypothetical protein
MLRLSQEPFGAGHAAHAVIGTLRPTERRRAINPRKLHDPSTDMTLVNRFRNIV